MKGYMMTAKDAIIQRFNHETIDISKISNFVGYYLCILQLAFQYQFISEKERNFISELILKVIYQEAGEDIVVVSNYNYTISLWLQVMSKYEAWEKISSISTVESAREFIREARDWFLTKVEFSLTKAKLAKKVALTIGDRALIEQSDLVIQIVNNLWKSFTPNMEYQCNLKTLHKEKNIFIGYEFLSEIEIYNTSNYLDRIIAFVSNFYIEMIILKKITSGGLISKLRDEIRQFSIQERNKLKIEERNINFRISSLKQELINLDEKYVSLIEESIDAEITEEEALLSMEEKFREEHPELDEDEMEDALDEFFSEVSLDNVPDIDTIKREYEEKRADIFKKIEILEKTKDSLYESGDIFYEGDDNLVISLIRIVKEYAIFEKSVRGIINYPSTAAEKEVILNETSLAESVRYLLERGGEFAFSEEEVAYLKSLITE